MDELRGVRVAILVDKPGLLRTGGDDRAEEVAALEQAGAETRVVSPQSGEVRSWKSKEWGDSLSGARAPRSRAGPINSTLLLLPGGVMNSRSSPDQPPQKRWHS